MEDRFEAISFPRIITTSSNSPYNDDVTPGKSVTSPWRPGIVLGGSPPSARVSEFSRWRWCVIGISRGIVSRDSTKTYARISSGSWMHQALRCDANFCEGLSFVPSFLSLNFIFPFCHENRQRKSFDTLKLFREERMIRIF